MNRTIREEPDGTFTVFFMEQIMKFKTMISAQRFLAKEGVTFK
jgi:hypothetical protein